LAIAVGLTPRLLPAIVTVSLAAGARRLARKQVMVERLVSIEDLGNADLLFTDKTGTLTEGEIRFREAVDPIGAPPGAGHGASRLPAMYPRVAWAGDSRSLFVGILEALTDSNR